MSPSSVSPDDMNRLFDLFDAQDDLLDGTTAERLLRADLAVDDAPPAYRDVTQALRLLTVAPEVVDHEREVRAVSAIARLIREGGVQAAPIWTAPRRERRLTQLVAVGAIGALSVFTGLASANALPDPAQHLAATVLEKIGINVPRTTARTCIASSVISPPSTGRQPTDAMPAGPPLTQPRQTRAPRPVRP